MVHRLHNPLKHHFKRAVALLTALVLLAGGIGIPLPGHIAKDTSRPFPCMYHACGCINADACWKGCCCMTHEQKLAWAREHHVRPPEKFLQLAGTAEKSPVPAAKHGCCKTKGCREDASRVVATLPTLRLVLLEDFRKCQGLGSLWLILSQALPPRAEDSYETELAPVSWLETAFTPQVEIPSFDPATPPPRAAV